MIKSYRLSELLARGASRTSEDESILYGDPKKLAVFAANPFLHEMDMDTRSVLSVDGVVVGGEYIYPVEIVGNGEVFQAWSGSETWVKEECRKQGVGLQFLTNEGDVELSDTVSLGCGMAQRYARIHKMFGYTIFPMYRHIALFKSRSVVEMKLSGALAKIVSAFVDGGLWCLWSLLGAMAHLKLRGVRVCAIALDDEARVKEVADMIAADEHRYRENHSVEWFKWHLAYALHPEGPAKLYGLERAGKLMGFFMTKRKFHEQASSRGFKNVMLGSVIEWGVRKGAGLTDLQVVALAVARLRKDNVDAAEVTTAEMDMSKALRHRLMVQVGESNLGIRVGGLSPLAKQTGWEDVANWRIRPAMCDNGL